MGEDRIYSGGHKRIACLIGAVLVVAMVITAAVPVSADDITSNYSYIAKDSFGIIYLSKGPLSFIPFNYDGQYMQDKGIGIIQYSDLIYNYQNLDYMTVLVPKYSSDGIIYQIYTVGNPERKSALLYPTTMEIDYSGNLLWEYVALKGYNNLLSQDIFDLVIDLSDYRFYEEYWFSDQYKITANYNPGNSYGNYTPSNALQSNAITVNPDYNISDAVGASGINIESLTIAINNAIESQTSTIINYGSEYIQFLPTQQSTDLGAVQDELHESESVLRDKSDSLASKASAGLAAATASAGQLAANLAKPAAVIGTVVSDVTATVPEEVLPVLTAAPLLSFIVWLIGLRK